MPQPIKVNWTVQIRDNQTGQVIESVEVSGTASECFATLSATWNNITEKFGRAEFAAAMKDKKGDGAAQAEHLV